MGKKKFTRELLINIMKQQYIKNNDFVIGDFRGKNGLPHYQTYINEFGSWEKSKIESGIYQDMLEKSNIESSKVILNFGFKILDFNKDNLGKFTLIDDNGYVYFTDIKRFKLGSFPHKVAIINPYSIQNIKLWCKLNNKPFELISDEYKGNHKKLQWKCLKKGCEEIFEATWGSISNGQICPYCCGQKVGLSNCLAIKNPELAKEWHPTKNGKLTPNDVTCGTNRKVWWQCREGHEWEASISNRNKGNGCPYCAGKVSTFEINLETINPKLTKEWNYKKNKNLPRDYMPNSSKSVWWICDRGHEWKATINNRNQGRGCPYCGGKLPSDDYNLAVCNPKLCEEWDYNKNKKKPQEYCPNAKYKVWWKCKDCGHEWMSAIYSRNTGIGCPECNKSLGENKITDWLNKYNFIGYIPQKEFEGLIGLGGNNLSYDFYLLTPYNILIEFQGKQHEKYVKGFHKNKKDFERQQEHDRRKRDYAKQHGIELLEIWYWDFDNIEKILEEKLLSKII